MIWVLNGNIYNAFEDEGECNERRVSERYSAVYAEDLKDGEVGDGRRDTRCRVH